METIIYLRVGLAKGFAVIMALVLLCVAIYTILKLRKQVKKAEKQKDPSNRDLLRAHYKRGEIDREDYEEGGKKDL